MYKKLSLFLQWVTFCGTKSNIWKLAVNLLIHWKIKCKIMNYIFEVIWFSIYTNKSLYYIFNSNVYKDDIYHKYWLINIMESYNLEMYK